jgi:uncharacterized membrane protein YcaP (DUF421 family)
MFEFEIKQITIELIIGFIALLVVSRVIRKTQIKQLTPFDFISAIVLGELLGNAVYDPNVKLWSVIYALILWSVLMLIVEIITQKFNKSRKVIEGEPAIIIRHGQIDYKVIKREKLDINNLLSMLRQKNCFSIREVEYAILEQGGDISILKKSEYDNPKSQDLNLPFKPVFLPVSLILDGVVLKENLEAVGFDEEWLIKQVKNSGLKNIKEVFFAEWKEDEGIHIVPRNK